MKYIDQLSLISVINIEKRGKWFCFTFSSYLKFSLARLQLLMCFGMIVLKWTHALDNETPLLGNERRSRFKHRNFNEITLRLFVGNTLKKKPVIY